MLFWITFHCKLELESHSTANETQFPTKRPSHRVLISPEALFCALLRQRFFIIFFSPRFLSVSTEQLFGSDDCNICLQWTIILHLFMATDLCGRPKNVSFSHVDLCSFAVYFKQIKIVCKFYSSDIFDLHLQSRFDWENLTSDSKSINQKMINNRSTMTSFYY